MDPYGKAYSLREQYAKLLTAYGTNKEGKATAYSLQEVFPLVSGFSPYGGCGNIPLVTNAVAKGKGKGMPDNRNKCPQLHAYEVCFLTNGHAVAQLTEVQAQHAYTRSDKTKEPMIIATHNDGTECAPEIDRQAAWAHKGEPFVSWRVRNDYNDRGGLPLRVTERFINGRLYRFTGSVGLRYITCIVELMRTPKIPQRQVHYVKIRRLNRYMFTGPRRDYEEYETKSGILIRQWLRVINGKTWRLSSACNTRGLVIMSELNVGGVWIPTHNAMFLNEEGGTK